MHVVWVSAHSDVNRLGAAHQDRDLWAKERVRFPFEGHKAVRLEKGQVRGVRDLDVARLAEFACL